jgi:hypothetical protein
MVRAVGPADARMFGGVEFPVGKKPAGIPGDDPEAGFAVAGQGWIIELLTKRLMPRRDDLPRWPDRMGCGTHG